MALSVDATRLCDFGHSRANGHAPGMMYLSETLYVGRHLENVTGARHVRMIT